MDPMEDQNKSVASSMPEIPKDIIEINILPKLPAQCLPKFKLVCKSFNSVISSPEFIVKGRLIILNTSGEGFHVFDLDAMESPPFFLPFPETFSRQDPSIVCNIQIFGSCKGFLCLGNVFDELMLLNPITGMFFNIPQLIELELTYGTHKIGFGFDDLSEDYKIVRIIRCREMWDVRVYSLRDNCWKVAASPIISPESHKLSQFDNGVLIDNHLLHWVFYHNDLMNTAGGSSRVGRISQIVCFNIKTEEWLDNVALPRDFDGSFGFHRDCSTLGVLDGHLCLMSPTRFERLLSQVNVWVMMEYGVQDSWVKLLGVSDTRVTSTLRMCPLGTSHGLLDPSLQNEILIARGKRFTKPYIERVVLIWYNIKDKKSRLSQVHKLHGFAHHFVDVCTCHKSLAPLPGGSFIRRRN